MGGGSWTEVVAPRAARSGPSSWVGVAVALAVVGFFAWRGLVVPALVVAVLATGLTIARHRSAAFDRRATRVLHAVSHGVGVALSVVLLGLLTLVLILPVWLVGRVLRWDALEPGRRLRGRWADHTAERGARRLDDHLYTREAPRRGWTRVHGLVVVAVPVAALFVAVLVLRPDDSSTPVPAAPALASGVYPAPFEDEPWAGALRRDERGHPGGLRRRARVAEPHRVHERARQHQRRCAAVLRPGGAG